MLNSNFRVFLYKGGVSCDTLPTYLGDFNLDQITKSYPQPSTTNVVNNAKFKPIKTKFSAPEQDSFTLTGYLSCSRDAIECLENNSCVIDIHALGGKCSDPKSAKEWDYLYIFEDCHVSSFEISNLNPLSPDNVEFVQITFTIVPRQFYPVNKKVLANSYGTGGTINSITSTNKEDCKTCECEEFTWTETFNNATRIKSTRNRFKTVRDSISLAGLNTEIGYRSQPFAIPPDALVNITGTDIFFEFIAGDNQALARAMRNFVEECPSGLFRMTFQARGLFAPNTVINYDFTLQFDPTLLTPIFADMNFLAISYLSGIDYTYSGGSLPLTDPAILNNVSNELNTNQFTVSDFTLHCGEVITDLPHDIVSNGQDCYLYRTGQSTIVRVSSDNSTTVINVPSGYVVSGKPSFRNAYELVVPNNSYAELIYTPTGWRITGLVHGLTDKIGVSSVSNGKYLAIINQLPSGERVVNFSIDEGKCWSQCQPDLPIECFEEISCNLINCNTFFQAAFPEKLNTLDCEEFQRVVCFEVNDIQFIDDCRWYFVGTAGTFGCIENCEVIHHKAISPNVLEDVLQIKMMTKSVGYALTGSTVYQTVNGGQYWCPIEKIDNRDHTYTSFSCCSTQLNSLVTISTIETGENFIQTMISPI